ncbi:hypothetical protein [Rhodovulum sp. BSW8]|uniref:hypothetical protein n=1 Tax=Rhodovulum sp. BSW8 TaxID=2259645 RepID=UPI0026A5C8CB
MMSVRADDFIMPPKPVGGPNDTGGLPVSTQACSMCAVFEDHGANAENMLEKVGPCRFNPPVSQPEAASRGLWPVVKSKDRCGHFETEVA